MEVTKDGIKKVPKGDWSNPKEYIGISNRFAVLNKLITRDLNNYRTLPLFLYTLKITLLRIYQTHIDTKSNCAELLSTYMVLVRISDD